MSNPATTLALTWQPPGPVSARFMASSAMGQILNGPIGSGKTTTCLQKAIRLAAAQRPSTRRRALSSRGERVPVRLFRLGVVRDTYRQLWKTTLPSWFKRVPREVGAFTGAENAPASHRVVFELGTGTLDCTIVEFQADFVAIGENAVEDVMRGYEVTGWYLNELDLLAKEVWTYARGRAGRFPDMADGGPTWYGVLGDCNAPEFSNWLYKEIFTRPPALLAAAGIELYRQPSGFAADAENLENLPPGYYQNQREGQPEWYVVRMLENRPGYSRAGRPIYPEFNDLVHVAAAELAPAAGIALGLGLDAGLHPAAVVGQRMPDGQRRVLDELVGEPGTGPQRFADDLDRLLKQRYRGHQVMLAWADPSAAYGVDSKAGEASWIQIVAARTGLVVCPAPTNRIIPRLEAVRLPLTRMIDGKPGLLLSPRCTVLREGFNAGYHFRKIAAGGDERWAEEPDKNEYSHPHDALQYWCSGDGENFEMRRAPGAALGRAGGVVTEYDPYAAEPA